VLQGHFVTLTLKLATKFACDPAAVLLQGYDVTLIFNVATQMLRVHIVHIATYSRTKFHEPNFNRF